MKYGPRIICLTGFLFSIPMALTSYVNSSFLLSSVGEYRLGVIYIIASIITIIGLFQMPKILTAIGNRMMAILFSLLLLLSFITVSIGREISIIILAFIVYFVSANLIVASLDIFIEDFSKNYQTGKIRGTYLTIINSAWVVAQVISGSVIAKSSFKGIYLLGALFVALVGVIFILFFRDFKDPKYKRTPILKTIKFFIQNKHFSKIYLLNLILKFFYAWMIIYTPIYLRQYIGFSWSEIGIIFSIMLIPFVILDFPLGKLADKIGEKKILRFGFLIIAASTLMIPLIKTPTIFLWALVLFFTRVGAATVEIMSESYFFRIINEENDDLISFFRNTAPVSYIIGPLFAFIAFNFIPSFNFLYIILGAFMLFGTYLSSTIKRNDI